MLDLTAVDVVGSPEILGCLFGTRVFRLHRFRFLVVADGVSLEDLLLMSVAGSSSVD